MSEEQGATVVTMVETGRRELLNSPPTFLSFPTKGNPLPFPSQGVRPPPLSLSLTQNPEVAEETSAGRRRIKNVADQESSLPPNTPCVEKPSTHSHILRQMYHGQQTSPRGRPTAGAPTANVAFAAAYVPQALLCPRWWRVNDSERCRGSFGHILNSIWFDHLFGDSVHFLRQKQIF